MTTIFSASVGGCKIITYCHQGNLQGAGIVILVDIIHSKQTNRLLDFVLQTWKLRVHSYQKKPICLTAPSNQCLSTPQFVGHSWTILSGWI